MRMRPRQFSFPWHSMDLMLSSHNPASKNGVGVQHFIPIVDKVCSSRYDLLKNNCRNSCQDMICCFESHKVTTWSETIPNEDFLIGRMRSD
eukprot:UN18297